MGALFTCSCPIKINLTLRVLGRREDGYHEIQTLFLRIPSPEIIEASLTGKADRLSVFGVEIDGENLITKSCGFLRERYGDRLPYFDVKLFKHLPAGSGVGAGSGNAAGFIRGVSSICGLGANDVSRNVAALGADVAFLASGYGLAFATGIGERMEEINDYNELKLPALIFFPRWSSGTKAAYAELDRLRGGDCNKPNPACRDEALDILRSLAKGSRVGMLPNDFICCMNEYEEQYGSLYRAADDAGAIAWGLCGSGSASFVIFSEKNLAGRDALLRRVMIGEPENFSWISKVWNPERATGGGCPCQ
ncbi:4-diphosphocytidyl-2-C-methyl-D-erythritol kinase [Synergistales bacterium]|nr:4-diphosphocytidyl-2-C-methyl-D-erythritol kinase [Synergistales bacterium]